MAAAASLSAAAQKPTYRSSADEVRVDASVILNRRTVTDLVIGDFSLTDNGVPQEIDDAAIATDPIDLDLLVDTGGELKSLQPVILRDVTSIQALLRAGDRSRVVTFDSQLRAGVTSSQPASRGEHGTVLFDAICAVLMRQEEPGRRRVIVVVTAGLDTHSLLSSDTRRQILQRSQPPVYLVAVGQRLTVVALGSSARAGDLESATFMADDRAPLREIADRSGGRLFDLQEGDSFLTPLRAALEEFRTRYILHYRPRDVPKTGWHDIAVKVTRPGKYEIRARRGYWRD
jgi:VWFA-related protein